MTDPVGVAGLPEQTMGERSGAELAAMSALDRALGFVAEFHGDNRCSLNALHAEALAAEVYRLRADLESERAQVAALQAAKDAAIRQRAELCVVLAVIQAQRDALHAQVDAVPSSFKCQARQGQADPPQDCDWPMCGCDPYADKVIAALQESGKLDAVPPAVESRPMNCCNCTDYDTCDVCLGMLSYQRPRMDAPPRETPPARRSGEATQPPVDPPKIHEAMGLSGNLIVTGDRSAVDPPPAQPVPPQSLLVAAQDKGWADLARATSVLPALAALVERWEQSALVDETEAKRLHKETDDWEREESLLMRAAQARSCAAELRAVLEAK